MRLRDRAVALLRKWGSPWMGRGRFWWPLINEPSPGAWQRNEPLALETVLAHHAVYACVTLIASDVAKLRPKLVMQDANGIWTETTSSTFSPVLNKPNHFQNYIQFKESWTLSKTITGNTYVLKERDERNAVRAMFVMDPTRVSVLVSPDGSVFYELSQDDLAGFEGPARIPASEIIHDRMNTIFHPLCGTSPIFACGLSAMLGLSIERNAATFFTNNSIPSGIITAPTPIPQELADQFSIRWRSLYSGQNVGRVAFLGNGASFAQLRMTAADSQLIEQLKMTAETVCSAFHVPPFKIGVGQMPTYSNGEILDQRYYSDCLQSYIEAMELCLDEGLNLNERKEGRSGMLGVELDLDGLLRMDTATLFDTLGKGVGGSILAPNEARKRVDLPPLDGGESVYMQQQNFSLAALAERDRDQPFAKPEPAPAAPTPTPDDEDADQAEAVEFLQVKEICDEYVYAGHH